MELTGRVIAVLQPSSGVSQRTGNPWMSQDYVIEVPGQYPRRCCFRVLGEDRIKMFNIQMNEEITVSFDIDAREYNGRWYNDVRAYNVQRGVAQQPGVQPMAQPQSAAPQGQPVQAAPAPFPPASQDSSDDLPF